MAFRRKGCRVKCHFPGYRTRVPSQKHSALKSQEILDAQNKDAESLQFNYSSIPSRRFMDDIFPCLKGPILFVGYDPYYTRHYQVMCDITTVDIDPNSKADIIVDITAPDVGKIIGKKFNTIVMNGVVGWGVNTNELIDKAFENVSKLLRKDGELLLGWNLVVRQEFDPNATKDRRYSKNRVINLLKPYFKDIRIIYDTDEDNWLHKYLLAVRRF